MIVKGGLPSLARQGLASVATICLNRAAGPYGEPVQAIYCRSGKRAVIEMASTAGLPMVEGRLNPEKTTTYGVGQLIAHAVKYGCTEVLLGLGGSCTNDGGCGCAAALGTRFFRENGEEFVPGARPRCSAPRRGRTEPWWSGWTQVCAIWTA